LPETLSPLLPMLVLVALLLLVIADARPTRRRNGKRHAYKARRPQTLNQYETGFWGTLVVVVLQAPVGWSGQAGLSLAVALTLGLVVLHSVQAAWGPGLVLIATYTFFGVLSDVVSFVLQPHEAGAAGMVYKVSFLTLVSVCFVSGAAFAFTWRHRLTIGALAFVVVLELLMTLAEPAFESAVASPFTATVTYGVVVCAIAAAIGIFSYPITLDLLGVALVFALAVATPDDRIVALTAAFVTAFVVRGGLRLPWNTKDRQD
jgi:hypothetical protein